MANTPIIGVRIPSLLKERLMALSKEIHGPTISSKVIKAIERFVQEEESKNDSKKA